MLGVREGVPPSPKPPVRIFLGTEPAQYRAERVFFWSIEQVRDPGRIYEIHLMKELVGFDRRGWLTGFTNYRFAIPHFAAGSGKAIYNDVDQVYLGDPGELFDVDLGEHGFLALSDRRYSSHVDRLCPDGFCMDSSGSPTPAQKLHGGEGTDNTWLVWTTRPSVART